MCIASYVNGSPSESSLMRPSTNGSSISTNAPKLVTAERYTHALIDYREVDRAKLLERVRAVPTPVPTPAAADAAFAGAF